MITVALKHGRFVCDMLTEGEPFVLNIVGEGQKDLLKHFGKGFEPGEAAFDGLEIGVAANGAPHLLKSVAMLECVPEGHVDSEDHSIFLAEVTAGALTQEIRPMTHLRNRGDRY